MNSFSEFWVIFCIVCSLFLAYLSLLVRLVCIIFLKIFSIFNRAGRVLFHNKLKKSCQFLHFCRYSRSFCSLKVYQLDFQVLVDHFQCSTNFFNFWLSCKFFKFFSLWAICKIACFTWKLFILVVFDERAIWGRS